MDVHNSLLKAEHFTVVYLMLLQREEDESSLPICIKHKLFLVTASHNIFKTESALNARCPFPVRITPCGQCFCPPKALQPVSVYLADFCSAMQRSNTSSGTCSKRAST